MKKFVNIIIGIVLLIMCVMNCVLVKDLEQKTIELLEIYDVEPEIVFLDSVEYDTMYITKTEVVRLPIYNTDTIQTIDTIIHQDSVFVEVPIELKHYSDTLQNVGISLETKGFNCEINNLYVKNFLSVPTQQKVPKKWYENIHLGGGLSVTYIDKFRVVPTIGIYYKLL